MKAVCISNICSCGCGFVAPIEIGLTYEIKEFRLSPKFVTVQGVTPFNDNLAGKIEALSIELFAHISDIDEKELAHAEPIESTFILKEI